MKYIVLLFLLFSSPVFAGEFADYCNSKNHTVAERVAMEQLKKIEDAKTCKELEKKINESNQIWDNNYAENCDITDIGFLKYFPKLERLSLGCHPLQDIAPIGNLKNLKDLILNSKKITDISPVAGAFMFPLKVIEFPM